MEKEVILKKAIVGGFDRVQVMNCIASLQEEAQNAKSDAEELKSLQATLQELEKTLEEKNAEIENLSADIAEAESRLRVSKTSAQLMKESVDYADRYVESAKILAQDITEKTSLKVKEAKEKIDSILSEVTGLSDDILKLYGNLAELKSEYDAFDDAYPVNPEVKNDAPVEESEDVTSAKKTDETEAIRLLRKAKKKYEKMI